MNIEREFEEIDFSPMSKIKEKLRARLLEEYSKKIELDEEDLDFLAAAGNFNQKPVKEND